LPNETTSLMVFELKPDSHPPTASQTRFPLHHGTLMHNETTGAWFGF